MYNVRHGEVRLQRDSQKRITPINSEETHQDTVQNKVETWVCFVDKENFSLVFKCCLYQRCEHGSDIEYTVKPNLFTHLSIFLEEGCSGNRLRRSSQTSRASASPVGPPDVPKLTVTFNPFGVLGLPWGLCPVGHAWYISTGSWLDAWTTSTGSSGFEAAALLQGSAKYPDTYHITK